MRIIFFRQSGARSATRCRVRWARRMARRRASSNAPQSRPLGRPLELIFRLMHSLSTATIFTNRQKCYSIFISFEDKPPLREKRIRGWRPLTTGSGKILNFTFKLGVPQQLGSGRLEIGRGWGCKKNPSYPIFAGSPPLLFFIAVDEGPRKLQG